MCIQVKGSSPDSCVIARPLESHRACPDLEELWVNILGAVVTFPVTSPELQARKRYADQCQCAYCFVCFIFSVTKYLREQFKQILILAHGFRGFSRWLFGSMSLGACGRDFLPLWRTGRRLQHKMNPGPRGPHRPIFSNWVLPPAGPKTSQNRVSS